MVEEVQQQEGEATSHILYNIKKQEAMDACAPFHTIHHKSEPPSFPSYLGQIHGQPSAPKMCLGLQELVWSPHHSGIRVDLSGRR